VSETRPSRLGWTRPALAGWILLCAALVVPVAIGVVAFPSFIP
jgi:hypothetical protein